MGLSLVIALGVFLIGQAGAANASTEALTRGNHSFTLGLYRDLRIQEKGNILFSPFSISLALAMMYGGARGETAKEIARVLGFSLPSERLHPAWAELSRHLEKVGNEGGQTLSVAHAVWLNTIFRVRPAYLKLIGSYYGNEMRQLDFCQGRQAQKTVNDWVANKTRDRITDLIPPGVLNCDTMLVLTDAVYFLGEWADKFDQKLTKPGSFWPILDQKVEASFMHRTGPYSYTETEGWQVLELPYREGQLSMVVLLPKGKGALAQQEKSLNPEKLASLVQNLASQEVKVTFPRFEVKANYSLNGCLKGMGMPLAFSPQADFGGITTRSQLWIDLVLHKAWLKVEEKGTEAAAATGILVPTAALMPKPPVTFIADHPFLFFIRDRETGLILFWGRLSQL